MFTSRAEYRILLRQDNADVRLTPLIYKLVEAGRQTVDGSMQWGGVPLESSDLQGRMERVKEKIAAYEAIEKFFRNHSVTTDQVNGFLESRDSAPITQQVKLHGLLLRPNITMQDLRELLPEVNTFLQPFEEEYQNNAEINMKYEGYIRKEQEMVDKMNRLEEVRIYDGFDFHQLGAISNEAREKLSQVKPRTIGQASRISGVTPSDVSVLLVHMGR